MTSKQMKGRQNSSADMLQRKRQGHTLGSTNSLHLKHSKCGDTTTLQWVEVSCQCASHNFILSGHWHCLHPACSGKVYRWNFHWGRKKGKHTSSDKIPEKKSLLKKLIESVPAVDSHHCRKGADKTPTQIQFVHQLNEPSGC